MHGEGKPNLDAKFGDVSSSLHAKIMESWFARSIVPNAWNRENVP